MKVKDHLLPHNFTVRSLYCIGEGALEAHLLTSKQAATAIYWQQQSYHDKFSVPAKDIYHNTVKRALQKDG